MNKGLRNIIRFGFKRFRTFFLMFIIFDFFLKSLFFDSNWLKTVLIKTKITMLQNLLDHIVQNYMKQLPNWKWNQSTVSINTRKSMKTVWEKINCQYPISWESLKIIFIIQVIWILIVLRDAQFRVIDEPLSTTKTNNISIKMITLEKKNR